MHRHPRALPVLLLIGGCTIWSGQPAGPVAATAPAPDPAAIAGQAPACQGSAALGPSLAPSFKPVDDPALLAKALGKANAGALCQGQVYESTAASQVVLFRAWNSTNPRSQFGNWWAFTRPEGAVSEYREDYEICYQWSPLDMLVQCTLQPGTRVVVGTGQSAQCSQYLTYPVSAAQQVFIDQSESSLMNCTTHVGEFRWSMRAD